MTQRGRPTQVPSPDLARDDAPPPESVTGGAQWNPLAAAALAGSANAGTAGVDLGTKALARRNAKGDGRPVNAVMATAITACDLAHHQDATVPKDASPIPEADADI